MVKGKKGKKGKKKKKVEIDPNALTEVDKTFYELTITDLNRKLARLRTLTQELEDKNEELQQQLETLGEDRADIISYLQRSLDELTNQLKEYQERLAALQETRENETEKFEEKIKEMDEDFKQMHEQLTSENKLLEGKLNSLEEFRSQREDLMKKFEDQENQIEEQEKRHKQELYEIERKFILSKDRMKKDMEAKLLQLSTDFQNTTELRVSATTHRVIRENIAVNNELELMLNTQKELFKENEKLKKINVTLSHQAELFEYEKQQALTKARVQAKVVERLTTEYNRINTLLERSKKNDLEISQLRKSFEDASNKIENLNLTIRVLEQNLHASRCERSSIQTQLLFYKDENNRLCDILLEAKICIQKNLVVRRESDVSIQLSKRENLLNTLFTLVCTAESNKVRKPSLETVGSIQSIYARGDLGFVPKPVMLRSKVPTKMHIESQTGTSLEEIESDEAPTTLKSAPNVRRTSTTSGTSFIVEETASVLFFDEEELLSEEEEVLEEDEDDEALGPPSLRRKSTKSMDDKRKSRLSTYSVDFEKRKSQFSVSSQRRRSRRISGDSEMKKSILSDNQARKSILTHSSEDNKDPSKSLVPESTGIAELPGEIKDPSQTKLPSIVPSETKSTSSIKVVSSETKSASDIKEVRSDMKSPASDIKVVRSDTKSPSEAGLSEDKSHRSTNVTISNIVTTKSD